MNWGSDFETIKRDFDADPANRMFGFTLLERAEGSGKIRLTRTPQTPTGIGGSVQGGILAAMVDIAMLIPVFSSGWLPGQQPAGTADLNISYLRPVHGDYADAEAVVIKRGRQLAVIEVSITDDQGRLCAKGRVLYAFRQEPSS
jgi:uncharacterized protein (TIGR00369 family)